MYDKIDVLILALGWMAVFEGISPLLFPNGWRNAVRELIEQPESTIRFFGAGLVTTGLLVIWWIWA